MRRFLFSLCLVGSMVFAASAHAGPVATPALRPPSGGTLRCHIANASDTKTLEVEWTIYDFNGNAIFSLTSTLAPHENARTGPLVTLSSNCVARVVKGGKANLRVSLYAEDSSGAITAAVNGQ